MAFSLTWLPEVLKIAGLRVSEVPGWQDRGRGDVGRIFGVICHHTATPKSVPGNMPTLNILINGRPGLNGPLSQLGLGRDGTYFIIAAGRANHAGVGRWQGLTNGNRNFIGIEAENSGASDDPWPDVQMDAYRRGVAAILKRLGQPSIFCAGHKEYALPPGRKPDPSFDMDNFRLGVNAILTGNAPISTLIPAIEPTPVGGGLPRPTLRRGLTGELTKIVQAKVGAKVDGKFGPKTEAAVRAFQRANDLVPDGIVGPKTWLALDRVPNT
jgi:peptidoglycan hydrolase-like protein with peptidoglycan-binding domain